MREYNYIYKTTNVLNGKEYIGVHKTFKLRDGYIGNGIKNQKHAEQLKDSGGNSPFIRAVLKYGYDYFIKEVLHHFDNYEQALEKEKELVNKEYIKRKDTYNVKLGGSRGGKLPEKIPYNIIDKNGNVLKGDNSRVFCKENNLNYWHFIRFLQGKRSKYRDYTLLSNYRPIKIYNTQTEEVYKTTNLMQWTRQNAPELVCDSINLLNLVLRKEYNFAHKIWHCCYIDECEGHIELDVNITEIIDENNKIYYIDNITKFIDEHDLSKTCFYRMLRNKDKKYKNFKFKNKYSTKKYILKGTKYFSVKGIKHPTKYISQETGEEILMQPGGEYKFENTQNVLEIPQIKEIK